MWTPHPANVIKYRQVGTGDMGDRTTKGGPCRFWIPDEPHWVLVYVRAHFSAGSGRNDIIVAVDSDEGTQFDIELERGKNRGTGEDYFLGILGGEYEHWTFDLRDQLVVEWSNPVSGTMKWGLEVALAPARLEA